jgi:hypothetical protein
MVLLRYLLSQRFFRENKNADNPTRKARLNPKGTTRPNDQESDSRNQRTKRIFAKSAEAGSGVRPASLIELIVTSRCVGYIRSRGRAKKELTAN